MAIYTEYSVHPLFVQLFFMVRRYPPRKTKKLKKTMNKSTAQGM
jgi:hypothetical protein